MTQITLLLIFVGVMLAIALYEEIQGKLWNMGQDRKEERERDAAWSAEGQRMRDELIRRAKEWDESNK